MLILVLTGHLDVCCTLLIALLASVCTFCWPEWGSENKSDPWIPLTGDQSEVLAVTFQVPCEFLNLWSHPLQHGFLLTFFTSYYHNQHETALSVRALGPRHILGEAQTLFPRGRQKPSLKSSNLYWLVSKGLHVQHLLLPTIISPAAHPTPVCVCVHAQARAPAHVEAS